MGQSTYLFIVSRTKCKSNGGGVGMGLPGLPVSLCETVGLFSQLVLYKLWRITYMLRTP